jgi:hypothetical protein
MSKSADKDIERIESGGKEPDEGVFRATVRIATDMYEFIELEVNDTPEAIFDAYRRMKRLNISSGGITDKEFDQFIENQLSGKTNLLETYNKMSTTQQSIVQINKRAIKRINAKIERAENE